MGYLLKEALKTLCGVNQWSYAVFWKIGCQNSKLLIWEECYYEPASYSGLTGTSGNENLETTFHDYNVQTGGKVHLLVNKMMMDNQINIVGEGLVGRVAFTGNHQWILSENYYIEAHPPEVLKELCQQFSAGMQTIAVIPVLPHGVVQFGSFMRIMENPRFVNDVKSLLLQLGYISGIMLSPNEEERAPKIGFPICLENSTPNEPFSFENFNFDQKRFNGQRSFPMIQNELQSNSGAKIAPLVKMNISSNRSMNGVVKAEVIPSGLGTMTNLPSSSSSSFNQARFISPNVTTADVMPAQRTNPGLINCSVGGSFFSANRSTPSDAKPVSGVGYASDGKPTANGNVTPQHSTTSELNSVNFPRMEATNPDSANHFTTNSVLAYNSSMKYQQSEHLSMADAIPGFIVDDIKQNSGDDLFDVLGADFKNSLFNSCWNSNSSDDWDNMNNNNLPPKKTLASSEIYSTSQGNSESGIFSSDHLLEAVVSRANPNPKPSVDEDVSCKTTLTNISSSSAPNTSLPYRQFRVSEGELFGVPKYAAKGGGMSSSKAQSGTYSQGSSIYGSQINSWIENNNDQKSKQNSSVSTGFSKKAPEETSKTNRKRVKPGENPRPRPKDRQMIQDRVKELREIVPNGAKCSIDALLERTIKHMLFLQSVAKHADKLKQTGESKIISKDGGLLLKDNFEGGATWAYEVGSQSMVCPIIVEDLNQPRQMLVEMLCEERGLFLEIADIIRGLGLIILKGVMETRNDKIWARFAVEANRDVTRMEIFISLVRLLEQSAKSGPPQPNGITGENPMAQQFHQIASIPAAVGLRSL